MGPASPRAFWWTAAAYFEALAGGMLPGDLDARRMCNRIESQIRRLADGSQNVAERLLRETLFHVAHAQPASDLVRQVQETFQLSGTLPGHAESSLAAAPAAITSWVSACIEAKPGEDTPTITGKLGARRIIWVVMATLSLCDNLGASPICPSTVTPVAPQAT